LAIHRALRKYGKENFKFEVLKECDWISSKDLECFFIRVFCSFSRNLGYNRTLGGEGNSMLPEDQYKCGLGRIGKHLTEAHKRAISKGNKGHHRKLTNETKEKLRKSLLLFYKNNPNLNMDYSSGKNGLLMDH
jgi:hypothetical protein